MMVPAESLGHAVRVSQGAGESHLLPPVEGATVAAQQRRALFKRPPAVDSSSKAVDERR